MQPHTASLSDSILFESWAETTAQSLTAAFTRRGLRVVRSFDLRSALATHADCDCPYHGTAQCTCQFAVLLVYAGAGAPVVVTVHSRDTQARIRIVRPVAGLLSDGATMPDPGHTEQVKAVLAEAVLGL
jgi:hypothetical protein